jgi:hypothetical protein
MPDQGLTARVDLMAEFGGFRLNNCVWRFKLLKKGAGCFGRNLSCAQMSKPSSLESIAEKDNTPWVSWMSFRWLS